MNLLTEALPQSVNIGEKTYPIQTNFRQWIKFSQIAFKSVNDTISLAEAFTLIYIGALPPDMNSAIAALLDFYNCGKQQEDSPKQSKKSRVFDFDCDAGDICAAFMQQYGIDLTKADLHWWMFKALFDGISEETRFGQIMKYRCADLSQIKDKEMKKFYKKMKRLYAIPDNRTEKEKERDFADMLSTVF